MAMSLKAARVNAGYTQEEVVTALNMSKTTLINYEKYRRKPDIETAQRIASFYGMSVDDIKWTA